MLGFHLFANSREEQHRRETLYADEMVQRLRKFKVPPFCFGANELVPKANINDVKTLETFVSEWFSDPERFLSYKNYQKPTVCIFVQTAENQYLL